MELAQPGARWRAVADNDAKLVPASAAAGVVSGGKIEVTLPDGTSVKVVHDVGFGDDANS
jgi:hypothetical protein